MKASALLLLLLACPFAVQAQRTIFVAQSATGANDGQSWEDAFLHLQDALADARSGDEVWVAEGVYTPDQGVGVVVGDRQAAFELPGGITLRGGFVGTERSPDDRLPGVETTLSGDLLQNDLAPGMSSGGDREDNATTILRVFELATAAEVDRVTLKSSQGGPCLEVYESEVLIQDASFQACVSATGGAGLSIGSSRVVVRRSMFQDNRTEDAGGALFGASSHVLVDSSTFVGNRSSFGGGAIRSRDGTLLVSTSIFERNTSSDWGGALEIIWNLGPGEGAHVVNSVFVGNQATWGGAISIDLSRAEIIGSVFSGNVASVDGGAISVSEGSGHLRNNSMSENAAGRSGDSVVCFDSEIGLYNSIFWTETSTGSAFAGTQCQTSVGNSILPGGSPPGAEDLGGTLAADPLFANSLGPDGVLGTSDDDLRLQPSSVGIDAGSRALAPRDSLDLDRDGDRGEILPFDVGGYDREQGGIDIGAHESASSTRTGQPVVFPLALEIFPNPSRAGWITVLSPGPIQRLAVYDAIGRRVYSLTPAGGRRVELPLSNLTAGAYLAIVWSEGSMFRAAFQIVP